MTKIQPLKIVGHLKKEWKTDNGIIVPFFTQSQGVYELHSYKEETDNSVKVIYELHKILTGKIKGRQHIYLYQELIDQLKSYGTILVDEDILKIA